MAYVYSMPQLSMCIDIHIHTNCQKGYMLACEHGRSLIIIRKKKLPKKIVTILITPLKPKHNSKHPLILSQDPPTGYPWTPTRRVFINNVPWGTSFTFLAEKKSYTPLNSGEKLDAPKEMEKILYHKSGIKS